MEQGRNIRVNATEKTFEIVETINDHDGMTLTELSDELDMATSTVQDHLLTLEELGYLEEEDNTYSIGLKFLHLGGFARSRMKLFEVAETEIQNLALDTGHHANLLVEDRGRGIFIYKAKAENAVQLDTYEGMQVYLHTTALGKSLLAFMPEERVDAIIDQHGLPAYTDKTTTDRGELEEELEQIRERGYALDDEERIRGIRCVAAPIIGGSSSTPLGAVSVSSPISKLKGERFDQELPEVVQGTANVIEVNMEYS